MRTRVAAIAFAVTLLPALAAAQPAPAAIPATAAPRLSLAEAIRLAVAQNLELESARLQVEKAEATLKSARTRRLPTFETEISASQLLTPVEFAFPQGAFGTYPGIGPIPSTDTNLEMERRPIVYASTQISQPLSQLFRIGLSIKGAALGRDLERERVRSARLSVENAVKRLYFALLQTRSALAAVDADLALYRELQRTVDARAAERVVLPADAMDVRLRLAQAELTRTTTEHSLASQREQMNRLIGRDVATVFEVEEVATFTLAETDPAMARSRALESRPDLREARLTLQQAEIDQRIARATRIPDLSLALSHTANVNIDVLPANLLSLGVRLTWEPFDWGRKRLDVTSKGHTVRQARIAVKDAEDRAAIDVNSRLRALGESRGALQVADLARDVAREKLRVKTNQFEQQAALLADVLHLRAELADSTDRYQQALLAFWTAKADFDHALGEEVLQ